MSVSHQADSHFVAAQMRNMADFSTEEVGLKTSSCGAPVINQ
jgi:hypothetical protein